MCPREPIPERDYIHSIEGILNGMSEVSDEAIDILSLERDANYDLSADDLVNDANHVMNAANPDEIRRDLTNLGHVPTVVFNVQEDYEDIFRLSGLSRRSSRPADDPPMAPSAEISDLMFDWTSLCFEDSRTSSDSVLPDDCDSITDLVEHLPARLDFNTWIARDMMPTVSAAISGDSVNVSNLKVWDERLASSTRGTYPMITSCSPPLWIGVIGPQLEGRLVWRPSDPLAVEPYDVFNHNIATIMTFLERAEQALVALARRIAREVSLAIIDQYVKPKRIEVGRPMISLDQLSWAVREILGEAWFDLPFDVGGSLKHWSAEELQLCTECGGECWLG